jgi:hypothetical protein
MSGGPVQAGRADFRSATGRRFDHKDEVDHVILRKTAARIRVAFRDAAIPTKA